MIKEIVLNGNRIEYDLQRKDVKNINLRIKADRTIFLSANSRVSQEVIEEFIESKSEYILKALAHYEELAKYAPKPKQYVDGETFRVLGHDRRLKVIEGKRNKIEYDESDITLTVKNPSDFTLKKKLIDRWLMSICKDTIQSLCDAIYPKFQKYGVAYPTIRYRNMVSRWGSCQPKNNVLTFNTLLIEAPVECIEYVVAHEFTHFLEANHSKAFYEKLEKIMPDWKTRKKKLNNKE